jgi:hypothetical protein
MFPNFQSYFCSECRNSFECELTGDLVDQFRDNMKKIPLGLPVIVLQSARITEDQGLYKLQNIICIIFIFPLYWVMVVESLSYSYWLDF